MTVSTTRIEELRQLDIEAAEEFGIMSAEHDAAHKALLGARMLRAVETTIRKAHEIRPDQPIEELRRRRGIPRPIPQPEQQR